jgi:hypothetical protein
MLQTNSELKKEYLVIKWNVLPQIHQVEGPEDLPLEILPVCSVDTLDLLASTLNLDILVLDKPTVGNYFDFFVGHKYPFAIRGADKSIYRNVSKLEGVKSDLLTSLASYGEDYDEFITNALSTFKSNVLAPTLRTLNDLPISKESDEVWQNESIPVVFEDLMQIVTQTDWLVQIVDSQLMNIKERYRALMRIVLPIVQRESLRDMLSQYIDFDTSEGVKMAIRKTVPITSDHIAKAIIDHLTEVFCCK